MKIKIVAFLIFTCVFTSSFAQQADNSYRLFLQDVVRIYKESSKPPLKNYFEVLSGTAKKAFNADNKFFLNLINDYTRQYKIDEIAALDTIFKQLFTSLKDNSLWISNNNLPKNYRSVFQLYNTNLCPCLLSKTSNDASMTVVLKTQLDCTGAALADTNFLNKVRDVLGENNIAEMQQMQQYLPLYMYENCSLINHKFNEVLYSSVVLQQYQTSIYQLRRNEGEKIFKFFNDNKFDSLEVIFPNYKKYTKQLTEIIRLMEEPGFVYKSYYFRNQDKTKKSRTFISITNLENLGMDVILYNSADRLHSTVVSMEIKKLEKSKNAAKEKVLEVKEDAVISTEKKN